MIVTTSDEIKGRRTVRSLGLVRGNTIRTRHIGRDLTAIMRNIVGVRFATSMVMSAAAELLAYGTAVELADEE